MCGGLFSCSVDISSLGTGCQGELLEHCHGSYFWRPQILGIDKSLNTVPRFQNCMCSGGQIGPTVSLKEGVVSMKDHQTVLDRVCADLEKLLGSRVSDYNKYFVSLEIHLL